MNTLLTQILALFSCGWWSCLRRARASARWSWMPGAISGTWAAWMDAWAGYAYFGNRDAYW